MMRYLLAKNSPKVRIYKDYTLNNNVASSDPKLGSSFLKDFTTLRDMNEETKDQLIEHGKGFAKFLAANYICGNYDLNKGNVGAIKDGDEISWASIDYGRGLSYHSNMDFNHKGGPILDESLRIIQPIDTFINGMDKKIYPEKLFKGIEFACEISHETIDINDSQLKKVIEKSFEKLKQAHGEDVLSEDKTFNINLNLCGKLGIEKKQALNLKKNDFIDKIIENVQKTKVQLQLLAQEKLEKELENTEGDDLTQKFKTIISNNNIQYFELLASYAQYKNDHEALSVLKIISIPKWQEKNPVPDPDKINLADEDGKTPLFKAFLENDIERAEHLIENGADINAVNANGDTALHLYATYCNENHPIDFLIQHGANINKQNDEGLTPLDIAIANERDDLIPKLIKHNAICSQESLDSGYLGHNEKLIILANMAKLENNSEPHIRSTPSPHKEGKGIGF